MTLNEQFKKNGFVVLQNVLLRETLEILSIDFKMMQRSNTQENLLGNDSLDTTIIHGIMSYILSENIL